MPTNRSELPPSALPAKEVTKVALRLKYQVEEVIPYELEQWKVTEANSPIITKKVINTAREAGGKEYAACVVYCLLVCRRWFKREALLEPWNSDMHDVRATACEVIAKQITEGEEDLDYLIHEVLLKRYSILRDGQETEPANVVERAVDLHALTLIGSSGYQKCINWLWKGWLHQDDKGAGNFVAYKDKANTSYWAHLSPDRMRAPVYQNAVQVLISFVYLGLYTAAVNTINEDGDLDIVEGILYLMTFGFICDEVAKFWKVGRYYFGFWNAFNNCLYALLTASFVIRVVALTHSPDADNERRIELNKLSYHIFAFSAPMFWLRLMLYLDSSRFFGSMLVVLQVMMKESLIFFALLTFVVIGFLQAFVGLNQIQDSRYVTSFVVKAMANAVMASPDFDGFDDFAAPFGLVLYYIFTFVVMVILLNILIALYNSAYQDITDNATNEYMALFARKTLQFVRAPDEHVFIAPFNLIEVFCLIIPFEWWIDAERYKRLNNYVMAFIYGPLLLVIAYFETREAYQVRLNRTRKEADDDTTEEWEQMEGETDWESEGWSKKVADSKPNVEVNVAVLEIRELRKEVDDLKNLVREMSVEPESK